MATIRTSQHTIKYANLQKKDDLQRVHTEYVRCLQIFVDHVWLNGWNWIDSNHISHEFSVQKNYFELPLFTSDIIDLCDLDSFLSGRALKCCMTQAAGIIKSACEKQRKRLYTYRKRKLEGISKKKNKQLINKIKQNIPQKPYCGNAKMELNSICANFRTVNSNTFDGFLRLTSITKEKTEIRLPIKYSKHSQSLMKKGEMMNSFLISNNKIDIRWELSSITSRTEGITIGADQGFKDVLTCSNGLVTKKVDNHGHSLESIIDKVAKKQKGGKAFKRAKIHQENFVNWSINQLNLDNIQQINLEEIWNISYKSNTSRKMSHWQNTLIRDKIENVCEMKGIRLIHQSATYRSQRCSCCGNVRKANRKGKVYSCKNCGIEIDSDLNAAKNHEIDLPEIPYSLRTLNINRKLGFFWLETGFFDIENRSLQSLYQNRT